MDFILICNFIDLIFFEMYSGSLTALLFCLFKTNTIPLLIIALLDNICIT